MAKLKSDKTQLRELKAIFEGIDENKKDFIDKLCEEAVFMRITLHELKEKVNNEGTIVTTTNGNGFEVTQENPALKSYNITIKNYNATIKTLAEIAPPAHKESGLEKLMND